jgi:spermidine synthase
MEVDPTSVVARRSFPWWWVLAGLYAMSGLVSLAYEVLWARMLTLQFGVSTFGVVLTVTAFMAGLGGGSLWGARRAAAVKNPLLLFALLELAIAIYALVLPDLSQTLGMWAERLAAEVSLVGWFGLQAALALLLLTLPALAMGAGFPLVLRALARTPLSLGKVYGLNSLGAAAGALLPLWLLPLLGWTTSVRVVAGLGLAVGVGGLFLAGRWHRSLDVTPQQGANGRRPRLLPLLAYAGVGAASLTLEVGWTRLYGMVMLRTEYVLAVILATFLLGIALGSLLLPKARAALWFSVLPVVAAAFSLFSLWMLPVVSAWIEHASFGSLFAALGTEGLVLAALTLPVTLALGAWLPLLATRFDDAGAWFYGANSLGAALGAMAAGFILIPAFGSAATVAAAALVLLVCGLTWASSRRAWIAVPLLAVAAFPLLHLPAVAKLLPQAQAGSRDLYIYEDAVSLNHVIEQSDGQRLLLTDMQRMDASTEPAAVLVQMNQARLPLLLHEEPRSVLFLGLGTGISAAGSLPFPGLQRHAVELSQGAIESARGWFAEANHGVMRDMDVHRDDARHFLAATPDHYDVIIGDLFHPDLAGHSSLLSVQQFQRARDHLTERGLFVQWIAVNQFDADSLAIVLRSFRRVFPDAQLFMDGLHLALVGPKGTFAGAPGMLRNLQRLSASQQNAATGREGGWTWLGRYWGPIPASTGAVQDEWSPVIEFRLPRARYAGAVDVTALLEKLLQDRPDVEVAGRLLHVSAADREAFERAYVATELAGHSWLASLRGSDAEANRLIRLAYRANPNDRWIGYALADKMIQSLAQARLQGLNERQALEQILRISPEHVEALRALWHLELAAGNAQQAEQYRVRLAQANPLDRSLRAVGTRSGQEPRDHDHQHP